MSSSAANSVDEVTLKQLISERKNLHNLEQSKGTKLWICSLLLDREIERRKEAAHEGITKQQKKKKTKAKKIKKQKRTLTSRIKSLKEVFSFRKQGGAYQIAATDEADLAKVASREFTDEDCQVISGDEYASAPSASAATPKPAAAAATTAETKPPAASPAPAPVPGPAEAKTKYPAIIASEKRYYEKQRQMEEARAEMYPAAEFLQLFWRLNKSLHVLVFGNSHGALCIQVYNKYTGMCYNRLFCTRTAVAEAAGVPPPPKGSEVSGAELPEPLLKYISGDNLQLNPRSGAGAEGATPGSPDEGIPTSDSHFRIIVADDSHVLTLKGVVTFATADALRGAAGLPLAPRGRMQVGRQMLTRTMTECRRITAELSAGLDESFKHLTSENAQAEGMVAKTAAMLAELEAATKLCENLTQIEEQDQEEEGEQGVEQGAKS